MRVATLASIAFENYYRLLRACMPETLCAAVYGGGGRIWERGDQAGMQVLSRAVAALPVPIPDWIGVGESVRVRSLAEGRMLFGVAIGRQHAQPDGVLAILAQAGEVSVPGVGDTRRWHGLERVAACLRTEFELLGEMEAMADELVERSEELNLIYETDDQVSGFAEGRESLQQLVRNCAGFLEYGVVALILPDKHIALYHQADADPLPDLQLLLKTLGNELYAWIKAHDASLVMNAASDPVRSCACPGFSHKIMACPVSHGGDERVSGILVASKPATQPDFVNSDRNLLEVMARKASKVIQASYDALTGLMNFRGFEWYLERSLAASRAEGATHSVINVDLDRLRVVNDISGRKAGDALLRRVAAVVKAQVRDQDLVARLGEDSFGVLLDGCPLQRAGRIAANIADNIGAIEFSWGAETHGVSACLGVTAISRHNESTADILSSVELALGAAKERGRGRVELFQQGDEDFRRRREEVHWVTRIQRSLRDGRFVTFAQPIRALHASDELFHFEVLVRMRDQEGKILPPGAFLPAAEHYYLMPAIDRWVIEDTLRTLSGIQPRMGCASGSIAINLSGQSLADEKFKEFVLAQLRRFPDLRPWLCFEITESAAIANLEQAQTFIGDLRALGCRFSLDDFGTGLSSFAYLKNLPVDYLKIDGSFVRNIDTDPVAESMVSAINQVGHVMGLKTIAEYVENDRIRQRLERLGIDYGQGYGIARPAPFESQMLALAGPEKAFA